MQLIRTTLRLPIDLKRSAEEIARETNTSMQSVFHRALSHYIEKLAKKKAARIVFKTHNLGIPLANLSRSDYYDRP